MPGDIVDSLIKLPAILTDVVLGYLVCSMALELGRLAAGGRWSRLAVVVFNPITWFDSVIWGQVDSFGTVFLLLGVRELWRGRGERARDPGGGRRPHQAAAGDPRAHRGRGGDPPRPVAERAASATRTRRAGAGSRSSSATSAGCGS